jgi:GDP-4-dehydro-6-deoxy-D-mannose reductase
MVGGPTIVTGAAGFAGHHLVDALVGRDAVIGWHHPGFPTPDSHRHGVDWSGVDVVNREAVRTAVASTRPARVYHLAGLPHVGTSWQQPLAPLGVHVLGTHYLLEAIREYVPTCRVLIVSSAQIYRPSNEPLDEDAPVGATSPYGLSKLAEDDLALTAARHDGLDVVITRPFNHTGPRQDSAFAVPGFARQIAAIELGHAPPEIRVGQLEARRDLTDVRDTVQAYARIMASGTTGRVYNVCTGHAYRIGDLLDQLIARSAVRVTTTLDPDRLRPDDQPVIAGNPSRVRGELGWTPVITLDQLLDDVLDWWRGELRRLR